MADRDRGEETLEEFMARQRRRCREQATRTVRRAARRVYYEDEPLHLDTYRVHVGGRAPLSLAVIEGDEVADR
jgi:hypothetical protein